MNRFVLLIVLCFFLLSSGFSQDIDSIKKLENTEANKEIVISADTTYFTVGEKKVEIIEKNDSTYVNIWGDEKETEIYISDDDCENNKDFFSWDDTFKNKFRFSGHWAGFEFGMNNYIDANHSLKRNADNDFMDINTNRSWNFNLNFAQYSIPFYSQYIGMVTGIGIEWSNYHFSNTNTIFKNTQTQQIEPIDLNRDLIMNRFQTTYLTIPLIFEIQFFNAPRSKRMYISGGVIGGIKLGAHTKYKYSDDGVKRKEKHRNDYYLRPFRYAFTGRIGYKILKVYMNYYPVSLFIDEKGPELYPIAMGFCITF